ncbi:2-hydroxyacid dehydrogenase [Penicillium angulare]|uniref:2-hydroxyacid dehydrogenase n=1 Tax=Penicillium angulare TaxID=116970 RepID=A0A9W9JTH2_9EURO|nr:2-hydroxyacid dehydrogenase [Penicillium angulare]
METCALSKDKLCLFFPKEPDHRWIDKICKRYPGLQVNWVASVKSDGKLINEKELSAEYWEGTTLLFADFIPPPADLLSKVRFVQLASAGANIWHDHPVYLRKETIFSNASGVYSPQIAEWVIGTWILSQRQLLRYQTRPSQDPAENTRQSTLGYGSRSRMGILGYGSIGRQCARIADALGMEVYAYTRSDRKTSESRKDNTYLQYCVPNTGDPEGRIPSKWFSGTSLENVNAFLAQDLDILVISLPLTKDTENIISHGQFEILRKKRTFVSNVARGKHINTDALVAALESGHIRGAALDVTDPEPLPKEHPLWKAPNVFITPHISWMAENVWGGSIQLLEANLERLNNNEPCINHLVKELQSIG